MVLNPLLKKAGQKGNWKQASAGPFYGNIPTAGSFAVPIGKSSVSC
jgi:hypothetical protein